jgi:hypothetical protein
LVALWEYLVPRLGVHTVHVVLDRALWQAAQRHPSLALIHHDEAGLDFEALEQNYSLRPPEEIEAVLNDLVRELLCILACVLGREVATPMSMAACEAGQKK